MKNKRKKSLLTGSIIILLIISAPYLLYIHQNIPEDVVDLDTAFGVIKGGFYLSAQYTIYWFFSKFVPLLLLIIWFITNKHWWVHALAIPISVYLFQLIGVVMDSEQFADENEFIYTVPIAVVIIVILYFIRSKMAIYILAVDLKKEMDENMKIPNKIK